MDLGNGAQSAPAPGRTLLSVGEIGRACFPVRPFEYVIVGVAGFLVVARCCPDSRWCGEFVVLPAQRGKRSQFQLKSTLTCLAKPEHKTEELRM